MKISPKILLLVAFGGVVGCSNPDAKNDGESESCEDKGGVGGAQALAEFDAMVKQVPLGQRCELKPGDAKGTYTLQVEGGRTYAIALPSDSSAATSALGAQREVCSGVPYWKATTEAATVDGNLAKVSWIVREDQQATAAFGLEATQGNERVVLSDCQ